MLGKLKFKVWFDALVIIWFEVPVTAKVCAFKLTSPVPLSPLKSKSLPASKLSTYAFVAASWFAVGSVRFEIFPVTVSPELLVANFKESSYY